MREPEAEKAAVLCISLAPAMQRTLMFERLRAGEVNRARDCTVSAGGKAVNTGMALACLRRPGVVLGFSGGDTGRFVARYLREHGVRCAFTRVPQPTRVCTTLLDAARGTATELVEELLPPPAACRRRFVARGLERLRRAGAAVICGTLSAGQPEELWAWFAAEARRRGVPVVIDSYGEPLRRTLEHAPLLVKMNAHELEKTWGIVCRGSGQVRAAARRLTDGGARWALITRGPRPAELVGSAGEAWQFVPPTVRVVSPIGSGDCVNAGIADALLRGCAVPDAVRFGLGCGSANACTQRPGDFVPACAQRLARRCRMIPVWRGTVRRVHAAGSPGC